MTGARGFPPAFLLCIAVVIVAASCTREAAPSAEAGRMLYGQHGCATCHGAQGRGDGTLSRTLMPPPRDFRDVSAFRRGIDETSIASTLATGIAPTGAAAGIEHANHTLVMPRYDHLSETERRSLARYLISLREPASKGTQP
jgi:high-affinity iron transporter